MDQSTTPNAECPQLPPLSGDAARQAMDALAGYDYQILRTVEAWLQLGVDEKIYIECAEDYDVIRPLGAVATQLKNSPTNITLNSEDVRDAVRNFWDLVERNAGRERILHALRARDGRRLAGFLTSLSMRIESTEGLLEALELLVYFGAEDGARAIDFDPQASLLMRYLQFRVARAAAGDAARHGAPLALGDQPAAATADSWPLSRHARDVYRHGD